MVPFLLTALHSWIESNDETPFIVIDLSVHGVDVPKHLKQGPTVVFNISSTATEHLYIGQEGVRFNARFSGASHRVSLPLRSIMTIFSKESKEGMAIPQDPVEESQAVEAMSSPDVTIKKTEETPTFTDGPNKGGDVEPTAIKTRGHLRLVK